MFVTVNPVSLKSGSPELVADGRLPQQARGAGPSAPGIKAGSHSSARDTMLHNSYTDIDTVLRGQQVTHWDDNSSLVNTTHTHTNTHARPQSHTEDETRARWMEPLTRTFRLCLAKIPLMALSYVRVGTQHRSTLFLKTV